MPKDFILDNFKKIIMSKKLKIRRFEEYNYQSLHINGKTIRIALDSNKPIKELAYPEFYDVKMEKSCHGGCSYCYVDSKSTDPHITNILEKFTKFFINMNSNQKPFQIAFGGGEPTEHPQFIDLMKLSHSMDIMPNYTTNGMWIRKSKDEQTKILNVTKDYCGGVALSTHPHLKKYWESAVNKYIKEDIFTNFHIIIGNKQSIDNFIKLYKKYTGKIKYFVLLPLVETGRAKNVKVDFEYLHKTLPDKLDDIAFGANFYPFLCKYKNAKNSKGKRKYNVSLYVPEIMSGYLSLETMKVYKSSFNLEIKDCIPDYLKDLAL